MKSPPKGVTIPYRPKPSGSPVIFAGGQVKNFFLFKKKEDLSSGCSINRAPSFVLAPLEQRTGNRCSLLRSSKCCSLLAQAYAVQGQHAIPQPDVSEGPSVSDPIHI